MTSGNERRVQREQAKKAVALSYTPGTNAAPVVVAKGRGAVAERILETARQHDVPVQEDSSLVEVLAQLDIEQEIPPELYKLVAEIMSFVYRTDRQLSARMKED